jgi:hypothetical protein
MPDTRIVDFTPASPLTGSEELAGVQSASDVKISTSQIKTFTNCIKPLDNNSWGGIFYETGILGESVLFGEVIYLNGVDSKWYKADASDASTSGDVKVGVCVSGGNANDNTIILYIGNIRADSLFPIFTVSGPVMMSETPGQMTQTAPTASNSVTRRIGFASTPHEVFVNISNDYYTHI